MTDLIQLSLGPKDLRLLAGLCQLASVALRVPGAVDGLINTRDDLLREAAESALVTVAEDLQAATRVSDLVTRTLCALDSELGSKVWHGKKT